MKTETLRKLINFIIAVNLLFSSTIPVVQAAGPNNFANCRLGAAGIKKDVVGYDMEQLNLGLYLDWAARGTPPNGLAADIEYLQVVRVHQMKDDYGSGWYGPPRVYATPASYQVKPDVATLATRVANNPGSIWLIGNEVERVDWPEGNGWGGQDEITPGVYATAYHDIYSVIKAADPTARVGIGGIIQATPLRLTYLDRVWASYQEQYGYSMGNDIDLWNIHGFIIREVLDDWGADIPAGFDNTDGDPTNNYDPKDAFLRNSDYWTALDAHHDMNYFRQFIEDFRAWMAMKGERNKPLLNTEYGILMDLDDAAVIEFLEATFDYMFAVTDDTTGYPLDENRLLQGWVWYSLNDNVSPFVFGTLFDQNKNLTTVGNAWQSYVTDTGNPLASQPQPNLLVANLSVQPNPSFVAPGETTDVTLKVDVANSGNTKSATGNKVKIKFWDGAPNGPGSTQIGSTQTLDDLSGCGMFVASVEVQWPNQGAGTHSWYVEAAPIANETNEADNIAEGIVTIIEGEPVNVYLPLILK